MPAKLKYPTTWDEMLSRINGEMARVADRQIALRNLRERVFTVHARGQRFTLYGISSDDRRLVRSIEHAS